MSNDLNKTAPNMEDRDSIGKYYTVGEFFEKYKVCIPILQRDYAQGREDREKNSRKYKDIRADFLKDIKNSLENNELLTMDFVYGYSDENNKGVFYPLDGQQRLTTIWLCYWYLALRAGKLSEEKDALRGFTYQTRKSSREFCEALCDNCTDYANNLVEYIRNQTWFYSLWKNDPTIKAMLTTLGGTNGEDGIEPVFSDLVQWKTMLDRLKKNVGFCVQSIDSEKLPREDADRLYVKMNARGKALTDFEKFKAELLSYIETMPEDDRKTIEDIPKNLDNNWNDIFWQRSEAGRSDGKTDEIFFAFINRFCYAQSCIASGATEAVDYFKQDKDIKYSKFDEYYMALLDKEGLQKLSRIFERIYDDEMKRVSEIEECLKAISNVVSRRKKTDYRFLPEYERNENNEKKLVIDENDNSVGIVKGIANLSERLYFFAVCKYFDRVEKHDYDKEKFKEWLRFCRNVIENSGVADSTETMIKVMKELDKNVYDPNDILHALNQVDEPKPDSELMTQIMEEIKKAKKISLDSLWKERIEKAEEKLFLCGRISFLFTGENGEEDWTQFEKKSNTLETSLFNAETAKTDFVITFAKSFEDFEKVENILIFHNKGWDERGDSWLDVLCDEQNRERVHKILTGADSTKADGPYKDFVDSDAFKSIVEKTGIFEGKFDLRISKHRDHFALYKKSERKDKLLFDDLEFKRSEMLSEMMKNKDFKLHAGQEIAPYFFGDTITFSYKGEEYAWKSDDSIWTYNCEDEEPKVGLVLNVTEQYSNKRVNDILESLKSKKNTPSAHPHKDT